MAVICHGCGGVVGRDCFNPQECEQITRSLANQALSDTQRYGGSPEEILNLLNEKDDKIEELEIKADSITRELSELREEIENLKSVMVAAAEEIKEHWQAHCDEEGYGPANLMHRLEKGIAANYPGYKPGAFNDLREENERLKAVVKKSLDALYATQADQLPTLLSLETNVKVSEAINEALKFIKKP